MAPPVSTESTDPTVLAQRPAEPRPTQPRQRAGKRWWVVAAAAIVAGAATGITASYLARPGTGLQTTSNQIFTSTGGSFHKESGPVASPWDLPSLSSPAAAISLAQFKGRPLVLNFWASWCPPCRKEMPALAATARRLAGQVAFVGIDTNDQRSAALAFASNAGVGYPLGFDPRAHVAGNYSAYGLPTTYFISAQGKILGRQVGGMTAARLSQLVSQTLARPATTPIGGP